MSSWLCHCIYMTMVITQVLHNSTSYNLFDQSCVKNQVKAELNSSRFINFSLLPGPSLQTYNSTLEAGAAAGES